MSKTSMPIQTEDTDIKQHLLRCVEQGILDGHVYWRGSEVEDRPIDIEGLKGKVRFIPSFAHRQVIYDRRPSFVCALCEAAKSREKVISLPTTVKGDFLKQFTENFIIFRNNFPYLDGQILMAAKQHVELFTAKQYMLLFEFMERTQFSGAAMQLAGSGATIPGHAHISIFNEELPIFSSRYSTLYQEGETIVSFSLEHPSVCYKITDGSIGSRYDEVNRIILRLNAQNLSFNLYLDSHASIYIIPRTNRRSKTLGIKIGLSLPAGTHNGYIEQLATSDIEEIKEAIRLHCEGVTSTQLVIALRETTVPNKGAKTLLG